MAAPKKSIQASRTASPSKMKPGSRALRAEKRLIVLYAPPKTGKTTALRNLKAKWLVADPNCIPTLAASGKMPPDEDTYEVSSLAEARTVTADALDVCEKHGPAALGVDAFVIDSLTQLQDWHKEDVAVSTSQRWLGDNMKNNGWQQYNTEFGRLVDDLVRLSRFVHVIGVCHAAPKPDLNKGQWAGLSLNPAIAERVGRSVNWLLFMSARELTEAEAKEFEDGDPFIQKMKIRGGFKYIERTIHTTPVGGAWHAAVNATKLGAEEPPDIQAMLEKEGLL